MIKTGINNFAAVFRPNLLHSLRGYTRKKFAADLMAGVTVGIVALPLAIAFGIASGVRPEDGIITAIIGGFIASALGGSSVQVSGPTGAFIVVVSKIGADYGSDGLIVATAMAGVILVLMGALRLGSVIKFIPYPIIVGFTAGIAVTIFSTQIKDFFGLAMSGAPSEFVPKWGAYLHSFGTAHLWTLAAGAATVLVIVYSGRILSKAPGSLLAILLITAAVWALHRFFGVEGIETIGDRFRIRAELPEPRAFAFDMQTINHLLPPAFTIAFLGAIESLLSATVADGVTGERHNSNTELIGQGAANIVAPFFGGIPVTGAIARTMTNINNGGRTPVAGIVHAAVLLAVLLFLGPLTSYIPMAALAGALIVVAYNMSEWRTFRSLLRNPKSDVAVLLITFFLTVLLDLTVAIEIGMLLAMLLFMRRVAETSSISMSRGRIEMADESEVTTVEEALALPKGVEVYEINGPFFFGIANKFDESMKIVGDKPRVRIIRMRRVPFMDSTGIHNLRSLLRLARREHINIVLSGVNDEVRNALVRSGVADELGQRNICPNINAAIERSGELV
jgi:SulP family sulfate permease